MFELRQIEGTGTRPSAQLLGLLLSADSVLLEESLELINSKVAK